MSYLKIISEENDVSGQPRNATFILPGDGRRLDGALHVEPDGTPVVTLRGAAADLEVAQEVLAESDGSLRGELMYDIEQDPWFGREFVAVGPCESTYLLPPGTTTEIELGVAAVLFGDGPIEDSDGFLKAHMSFDGLSGLISHQLPNPAASWLGEGHRSVTVDLPDWRETASTAIGEVSVYASFSEATSRYRHTIERTVSISVESTHERSLQEWLSEVVAPIEALLTFLRDRAVRLTSLQFAFDHVPIGNVRVLARGLMSEVWTGNESADTTTKSDWISRREVLFRLDEPPVPLPDLVAAWFELWVSHAPVLSLFLRDRFDSRTRTDVLFLSRMQAAEGLHRGLESFPQQRWSDDEFSSLKKGLRDSDLVGDQKQWIGVRIQWNEPSQRERLRDLCTAVQDTPLGLIFGGDKLKRFIDIAIATRNDLTHRLEDESPDIWRGELELGVLAECVGLVVDSHVLEMLGVPFDSQRAILANQRRFRWTTSVFQPTFHRLESE